jgi:hypothetical protein
MQAIITPPPISAQLLICSPHPLLFLLPHQPQPTSHQTLNHHLGPFGQSICVPHVPVISAIRVTPAISPATISWCSNTPFPLSHPLPFAAMASLPTDWPADALSRLKQAQTFTDIELLITKYETTITITACLLFLTCTFLTVLLILSFVSLPSIINLCSIASRALFVELQRLHYSLNPLSTHSRLYCCTRISAIAVFT